MCEPDDFATEGLDLLDIGVGIFDSNFRLTFANMAFRALRRYPEEICRKGVTLDALLRFNAERGDFGVGDPDAMVAERLAEIELSKQREIEREMADGQILGIRYRRTASGGMIVTFEDRTAERRAEAALKSSEERYAVVADAAEEAIYEWTISEDKFFAAPRLLEMVGRDIAADGVRDWEWTDFIHPDDLSRYQSALSAHLSGEEPRWSCEYRLKDASGVWRWVLDHGTSIRDDDSKPVRMVAAVRDITERVDKDAALIASEERHTLVTQATSDGIYDWSVTDDLLYISATLQRLLDCESAYMPSHMWAERVHLEDYERYIAGVRAYFKCESDELECEYRVRSKGDEYLWIQDRAIGVRDENGWTTRLVGAVRDITDIREAKAALDRSEAQLMSSLETISDGILLVDGDNRVQLWNDRYYQIFSDAAGGVELSNVIVKNRPFFDMISDGYKLGMFKPHPDGADAWLKARMKAWEQPASQWELELANGNWLLLNERRTPDGGRVSVYTDITQLKQREREAQAAREQFEEAIEAISTGFALFDAEDRLMIWNSRFRDYFAEVADVFSPGIRFRNVLEASIGRGMFPAAENDPEEFLDSLMEKRSTGVGRVRENLLSNGMWLQITDHRTKEGGIASIYTDVTELKTRELELRDQSAILEATMENMGQGISMVDRELNAVAFNKKFLELQEFPEDHFGKGFSMEEAFRYNAERGEYGPGDVEEQVCERVELSSKFLAHRFERTRADGVVLEIVGNPVEGGGFVSTYTDITERKRAEQALKDREAELEAALQEFNAVLDNIDYGVLFMGSDLRVKVYNPAFLRLWNIPKEFIDANPRLRELIEFNRHSSSGFYDVAPEDWDDWLENRIATVSAGRIPPTEVRRADGSVVSYQCVALPDGGRMLTYFDITELKDREAEMITARDEAEAALTDLRKAQERLVQAEKMASLGQLTAGIAHEIKNPLNFVNNFAKLSDELLGELAEILEAPIAALDTDERDDAEDLFRTVRENLEKINEHGRRADSIVKNMLLHSREGPSEQQVSNLNAIADEALNLAYHGARAENPGFNIEMIKTLAPDVGDVECFPQDLMRVFLNLITNGMYAANKRAATEDGFAPTIAVTTRTDGNHVEVEVRDNGAGITPEVREKIFVPFFTTKPAGEGTGLGLSLSYDIVVKQHGGDLNVDSIPDEFTAFRVTLPRSLPASGGNGR